MRIAIALVTLCALSAIAHAQRATVVIVDDSMSSEKLEIASRALESAIATLDARDDLTIVHAKKLADGVESARKTLKGARKTKRVVLLTEAKLGIAALGEKLLRDKIAMETPPLDSELRKSMTARVETKKREPVAVVFVIDRGWSMGAKLDTAKKIVKDVIDGLANDDLVGVVTFESESSMPVPLQRASAREIGAAVQRIELGVGSILFSGLNEAELALKATKIKKRVVVIADQDGIVRDGVFELVEAMADERIEVSTVSADANYELWKKIAAIGGGESFDLSKQTAAQIGRWLRD